MTDRIVIYMKIKYIPCLFSIYMPVTVQFKIDNSEEEHPKAGEAVGNTRIELGIHSTETKWLTLVHNSTFNKTAENIKKQTINQ